MAQLDPSVYAPAPSPKFTAKTSIVLAAVVLWLVPLAYIIWLAGAESFMFLFWMGLSAVLHEAGHARVMKKAGCMPLRYCMGFGRELFVFKRFSWRIWPIGAAVLVDLDAFNAMPFRTKIKTLLAGVAVNFMIAIVAIPVLVVAYVNHDLFSFYGGMAFYAVIVNVLLGVMNLFPIPGLDGFRVLTAYVERQQARKTFRQQQSPDPLAPVAADVVLATETGTVSAP